MQIRYENTLDDLVAFSRYHAQTSPGLKKLEHSVIFGVVALLVIAAAGLSITTGKWSWAVAGVLSGMVGILFGRRYFAWVHAKVAKRLLQEGNRGMLGWHELDLAEHGLVETCETGSQTTRYKAVERVVESPEFAFIYITAVHAHAIPRRGINPDVLKHFLDDLRSRVARNA